MKNFHCDHCDQPVFFENSACLKCGHALTYLPDLQDMVLLEAAREDIWHSAAPAAEFGSWREILVAP